jgi:hypothetical protein
MQVHGPASIGLLEPKIDSRRKSGGFGKGIYGSMSGRDPRFHRSMRNFKKITW